MGIFKSQFSARSHMRCGCLVQNSVRTTWHIWYVISIQKFIFLCCICCSVCFVSFEQTQKGIHCHCWCSTDKKTWLFPRANQSSCQMRTGFSPDSSHLHQRATCWDVQPLTLTLLTVASNLSELRARDFQCVVRGPFFCWFISWFT